jgi:hypothetical protein
MGNRDDNWPGRFSCEDCSAYPPLSEMNHPTEKCHQDQYGICDDCWDENQYEDE